MAGVFKTELVVPAFRDAVRKLDPRKLWRNPVMLSVEVGSLITTFQFAQSLAAGSPSGFLLEISVWLWLTVLFGTFAESFAEIRSKARTDELRAARTKTTAKRITKISFNEKYEIVHAGELKRGDLVLVESGDIVPSDGEVVSGSALVDESAVTGESAPVVRESGGERCGVVSGAKVISNALIVRITVNRGETFMDRMIKMIDAAKRPKTPNEIALDTLLISLTVILLFSCANLWALSVYSANYTGQGKPIDIAVLVALFVCLAPTTIAALLPAIGIAGMDRLFKKNVVAMSGKAVEASGDIGTIILDKTGTITYGNRQAVNFIPLSGHSQKEVAQAAFMASWGDETPEGRSISILARDNYGVALTCDELGICSIPFTAQTRMSGIDVDSRSYRKGAPDSVVDNIRKLGGKIPENMQAEVDIIAMNGGTPLAVYIDSEIIGLVNLKDVLKTGIKEKLEQVKKMGIKVIIITGDNPLTAACIAKEAGITDYVAQARPEDKLRIIKEEQAKGFMVAMTGDGTNDAPALAQADVAVAMGEGTQVAKEAANMIDLDNHPAKLIEIVRIGKEILMTRGALTAFSIANDIAKYFAIVPAALYGIYPQLGAFNILGLETPQSAILSAVIFNALIIILMVPVAVRGVKYEPKPLTKIFRWNVLVYGIGGILAPFIGIKIIDIIINAMA